MSYVSEMRALVGPRPLLLVGAGVLITDARGRVLLLRRTDNGRWGLPGGGVELNESAEDAARREVFEETGLTVGEMSLLGVFSGPGFFHVYPNGDQASIVAVIYRSGDVRGEPRPDGVESCEVCYFAPDELPDPTDLNAPDCAALQRFLSTDSA